MEVNKFVPGKFDIKDEDETSSIRIVADLAPEEEFIENLKYWVLSKSYTYGQLRFNE